MTVISLANQKGGCGKTTVSVNLASALSRKGNKVLLIDSDPQHHATINLGYTDPSSTLLNIFDNIFKNIDFNPFDYMIQRDENMWFIPSEMELSALEPELSGKYHALEILSQLINKIDPEAFDYVIIDCPPSLGLLTLNALKCTDVILVPVEYSVFSLMGARNLEKILSLLGDCSERVPSVFYLLNMHYGRSNFAKNFMIEALKEFSDQLFSTTIRNNIHIREAALIGKTIFEHNVKSRGASDMDDFACEFIDRINELKPVDFSLTAPAAQEVYVVGDFNNWEKRKEYTMIRKNENWQKRINLHKGKYHYKFVVDERWTHDNINPLKTADAFGGYNSLLDLEN